MHSPTGYRALYDTDIVTPPWSYLPVATWNEKGQALVFDRHGQLVIASEQPSFLSVVPEGGIR